MAILENLLKPKWKNNNPEIRMKALMETKDEHIIAAMAKEDTDKEIRRVAIKKLNNYQELEWILLNDRSVDIRKEIVDKIDDIVLLKKAAEFEIGRASCRERV